ncbi:MFS transporter [Hymenobacter sp. BT491]|uniref:MFS transporter n=1 Tax=Hymenobacter sp. BT491 TaxID=2766779 RepID=UPI001653BF03|nr:MFS transporter [Hymenobacter sp. BT491]MBC6990288.1 MFS transporter [Hymenobacter sp. BT491]
MLTYVSSPALPKHVHRLAVGALFFLQGLCFASWASRIPTIQQKMGFSDATLGAVLFALPVGLMISLPLSGWLVTKKGSRTVAIGGALLYSTMLASLGLAQNVFQLVACLLVFGFAGNMMNIAVNTQAVGVESLYRKSIMASFHGLWSLAGFTGAAVGTLMIGNGIEPFHHFLLIMIMIVAGATAASRFALPQDSNRNPDQPIFAKPDKSLINLGIIAFCSMICEGAMFDWSGVYFKKVVLADQAWIGAGYTAFMSTMAGGRFVADWLTTRIGVKRVLLLSGTLTASGLALAVLFPTMLTAIVGFLLVGAGVSSVVPLVYSAAGRSEVLSPGVALAAVSTIGFLGFLIGPPMIGLVAGATSLRISFSIIAVMGLCIAVVASRSKL